MAKPQFTLRLNVGDEQDTDLPALVKAALRIKRELKLEAVEFEFRGATFTVTETGVVQTIPSSSVTAHFTFGAIKALEMES